MMPRRWRYVLFAALGARARVDAAVGEQLRRAARDHRSRCTRRLTLSWNFIGGFTGYPSFSTAAFFGLGCYAGALSQRAGVPMVLAWAFATLFVGAFAAALGAIILRLRGHYFAIGSIGVVEVVRLVDLVVGQPHRRRRRPQSCRSLSGGPNAVARIFLAVMIVIMLIAFVVTVLVDRSRFGFGLRCIQQNEDAADMVGVDTTRYKVIAYTLSALFCGTVGAAYASWTGYIDPNDSFSIIMTIKVPVMCLLGGAGHGAGPGRRHRGVPAARGILLGEFPRLQPRDPGRRHRRPHLLPAGRPARLLLPRPRLRGSHGRSPQPRAAA